MSKTVDQRVVEMRFDNKDFEANVKTSMTTLEKLKHALKLDGVAKGLDGVSSAAKKVNFSGMTNGIETVNARFSAMQVVGMTALANITTAAMQAGKNLVNSFTFKPITDGFREYELQMNSVQTILANTKSKGTTIDDVTAALDELNTYADQTIYNFGEMTKNIGTFTAAGVDLDKATAAIKGIANLGAMSGSTSAQVSSAMYQLSQALAAGKVSLMDWNSVVNAGMGGEQFQNALKRTAEHFGTNVDALIEKYGSFRESLTSGQWLTTEVLTETLNQIGGAYDETALKAQGWSDAEIAAILDMSQTATDAATKVKTFTQLMDTLAEAAGSGWAKTWQIIFGDFEEAKSFFTDLSNYLGDIINTMSDARNNMLSGAFDSKWGDFTKELDNAGVSVDAYTEKLREVAKEHGNTVEEMLADGKSWDQIVSQGVISSDMFVEALKRMDTSSQTASQSTQDLTAYLQKYQGVVHDVWMGNYGNIDTGRIEKLTAAGWDYAEVQALVNKTVNDHRLDLEDLTDAQLKSAGYTQKEIDALHTLAGAAEDANTPIGQLIQKLERPSGRVLFLESIQNILKAIIEPLKAVSAAFGEVFAVDPEGLYNAIAAFNRFTKALVADEDTLKNITSTFKGLFGILKIFTTLAGGAFSIAFQALTLILEKFDLNILDVTAAIGEIIYLFSDWLTSGKALSDLFSAIVSLFGGSLGIVSDFFSAFTNIGFVKTAIETVSEFFGSLADNIRSLSKQKPGDVIKTVFNTIKKAFSDFKSYIKGISWDDVITALSNFGTKVRETFTKVVEDMKEIGPDILEGLQNGLKERFDVVVEFMGNLASKIVEAVKAILGIRSPSTVFFEIGKNIIDGLCNGIKYFSSKVTDTLSAVIGDVKNLMSGIDWGAVMMVGAGVGAFVVLYQLTDALQTFATGVKQFSAPFQSASKILETTNNFLQKLTEGNSSNKSFANVAQGIKLIAEAIAILVGSVAVLTALDPDKMWEGVKVIGALAAIIGVLAAALNKFANGGTVLQSLQLNSTLLSLAGAFLMLSISAKIISGIDSKGIGKARSMLIIFASVVGLLVAINKFGGDVDKVSGILSKIGVAFLLLAVTARLLGGMSDKAMGNASLMITVFTGAVAALVVINKFGGDVDRVSNILSKIGIAFLLLSVTARLLGGMSQSEIDNASIMLSAFVGVVSVLVLINQFGGEVDKVSGVLAKIGTAFLLLAIAAKLIATMSWGDMAKAAVGLTGLAGIVALLVLITNLAPPGEIAKITTTLIGMSLSIAVLAGVAALLGMVKTENLVKGVAAVSALAGLMAVMTMAARGVPEDAKNTFIGMSIAIGVLAASVAVLSFIDPAKLATATAAMSALMGMFALVAKSASNITTSMGSLIAITVAIGLIGAALYLLAGLPSESVLGSAIALSSVLVALATACRLLDGVGKVSGSALATMGILTLVMVGLAAIFAIMSSLGVEASLPNAIALSTVLLAMSAACAILGTIQSVSGSAMAAIAVLTLVIAGLAVVFGLMSTFGIEVSLETALGLSTVLLAMSAAVGILGAIGPLAQMAVAGAAAMAVVIGIIAGVVAAAGAIKQIPGAQWLIDEGGAFLQSLGSAIGGFVGSIAGGFLDGATSTLGNVGSNLSAFAENAKPFFEAISGLDPNIGSGLSSLATGLLAFTASGVIDQLTQFLGGESNFDTIKDGLPKIGDALVAFNDSLGGITDFSAIQNGATAFKALAEAMSQVPNSGGLLGDLLGGKDYTSFADAMESIGGALASFNDSTASVSVETLQPKAEALKTLIQALSGVPNSGGLLGDLLGGKDYGSFADAMGNIGEALSSFDEATSSISVEVIQPKIEALKSLITALSTIPNTGGWLGDLLGEQDYSSFATAMSDIGDALASFNDSTSGIGDFEMLNSSIESLKSVITTLSTIPTSGGWLDNLFGDGSIDYDNFSSGLESIGNALKTFSDTVPSDTSTISAATTSLHNIINLLKANSSSGDTLESGITNIKKIKDVGKAISDYYDSISDIDTGSLSSANNAIQKLVDIVNNMVGIDTSGIAAFKSAMSELATVNVDAVVTAFSDAATKLSGVGTNMMQNLANGIRSGSGAPTSATQTVVISIAQTVASTYPAFVTGGQTISKSLAQGITDGGSGVKTSVTSVLTSAASSIRGYYSSFYSAGSYLSAGLAAGMRSKLSSVRSAATEMANLAAKATRAAAQVKSPSRVFKKIGGYMGEGLIIGLDTYQKATYKTAYAVGNSAVEGLNMAVNKMSASLDPGMELNPVITPVIDLSNVQNGVSEIDSMLGGMAPLNVLGEVDSISRAMNQKNQNESSFVDVVKAVDKLRNKLDDLPSNQTIVNGVTYDDGTNVSNAVGSLVRAIRLEGRI